MEYHLLKRFLVYIKELSNLNLFDQNYLSFYNPMNYLILEVLLLYHNFFIKELLKM